MYRLVMAVAAAFLVAVPAWATPVVVWLSEEAPSDRDLRRAESLLDHESFLHLAGSDLEWPVAPWTPDDATAYDELRAAVIDGRARWDQFDVELDIAEQIGEAIDQVTVVRDRRDLEQVASALLVQGAAVERAFPPFGFEELDEAEPFRTTIPGTKAIQPWVWAIGLQPDRGFNRGDLADGGPWPAFETLRQRMDELPPGYLDLSRAPRSERVVVNGVEIEQGVKDVELGQGFHFVHLVRDGVISGRQVVRIDAGRTASLAPVVDVADIQEAAEVLAGGSVVGFPASIDRALASLLRYHGDALYVATSQDGRVVVQPFGGQATRIKRRPVTVLINGELGGGAIFSSMFDDSGGESVTAPMASGGLGLEIGIYYGVILGGFDLAFTPGRTVTYATGSGEDATTSVLPQAWGGVGAYILRPNEARPTILLAGTYGWYGPSHLGFGGRAVLGIPVDQRGTWFRLTLGGVTAPRSQWDTGSSTTPMQQLFGRFGFGARF